MLAILASHPIQYYVPIWQQLAAHTSVPFEVWYLTRHGVKPTLDKEFGAVFSWDLESLANYPYSFPEGPPDQLGGFWQVGLPHCFRKRLYSGEVKALFIPGWNLRACWEAVFIAHHLGIPVWMRGDSNDLKPDPWFKGWIKRLLLGAYFRRISQFLYVGAANRRLYERYGVPAARLCLGFHAVDNRRFANQAQDWREQREVLRARWGIPSSAFCVLFAGKFISKKRPSDILAALKLLQSDDREHSYHALFAGTGELGAILRQSAEVCFDAECKINESSLDNSGKPKASFVGFLNQTEISQVYVAADVLILPSDAEETWGLVVNEALASGLQAIVSDACGCAEDLVVPLDTSLCYPMGDVTALARAIQHAADQPVATASISSHIAHYNFSVTVATLECLWHGLQMQPK